MAGILDIIGLLGGKAIGDQPVLGKTSPTNIGASLFGLGMPKTEGVMAESMPSSDDGTTALASAQAPKKESIFNKGGGALSSLLGILALSGLGAGLGALSGGRRGAGQGAAIGGMLGAGQDLKLRQAAAGIPALEEEQARKKELADIQYSPTSVEEFKFGQKTPGFNQYLTDRDLAKNADANSYRDEMLALRKAQFEENQKRLIDQKKEEGIQKLGKSLEETTKIIPLYDEIENRIGFNLYDYDEKTNSALKKDPKSGSIKREPVDIPGVSLRPYGRVAIGEQASDLASALQRLSNAIIYASTGKQLNNSEMIRIEQGLAQGKFNTEPSMIRALKEYKKAYYDAMRGKEAIYAPYLEEYKQRGGINSDRLRPPPTQEELKEMARQRGLINESNR